MMKTLSIPEEDWDRHALPLITPTLQLMDYPEVFAGGDYVTQQKPESALAQGTSCLSAGKGDHANRYV